MGAFDDLAGGSSFDDLAQTPATPVSSRLADLGRSVAKGVVGAGEAAVGLGNIATGGRLGNSLEQLGYQPTMTKKAVDEYMSEGYKADQRAVQETKGFFPTVAEVASRPWFVGNVIAESAPSMVGGFGAGRALQSVAPRLSGELAGALGEGVVSAGSTAEQTRQDTGTLDARGTAGALAAGAGTAAIGAIGNVAARAAKAADIDTAMLSNVSNKLDANIATRAAKGAGIEAAEETAQSAVEQMAGNFATGKPLTEGVAEQAAIGGVTGGVMGGGFAAAVGHRGGDAREPQNDPAITAPPGPLQAAAIIAKATGAAPGDQPAGGAPGASQAPSEMGGMGGTRGLIAEAAKKAGTDPLGALLIASIETGGRFNADAKNPKSSASGMFQFMDATRKMFPEVTPEMWADPKVQAEYGARFIANTNAAMQKNLGREIAPHESYMGHLLGSKGAVTMLTADPNMLARDVIASYDPKRADQIVRLNGMKDLTAGEAVAKWQSIAKSHLDRLGVEQQALPLGKEAAEMRVRAMAREGQMLEVVEHPTVPGKFAALPPMGGDPNEAQPESKVPLIADPTRTDYEPEAPQTIQAEAQGAQPAAALDAGLPAAGSAVAQQAPEALDPGTAAPAAVTDPTEQAALQQELAQELAAPVHRSPVDGRPISAAQIDEGNYPKIHERWNGLDLTVENKVGDTRTAKDGSWSVDMQADYGYIRRTVAADKTAKGKPDRIDFYKPPDAEPDAPVYVFDQVDPKTGDFDEHKVVFGVTSREQAELLYDQHFNDNSGPTRRAAVAEMSIGEFKRWLKSGTTADTPASVAQPQVQRQLAIDDGIIPPETAQAESVTSAFSGVPEAAKWAADIQAAATRPQELNADDQAAVADLNTNLSAAGFAQVSPLRSAPQAESALVAAVAERAFGKRVIFTEPAEGFSGVAFKDRIYLAANETNPAAFTVGHEVMHTVEGRKVHEVVRDVFRTMGLNPEQQVSERQAIEQAQETKRTISRKYAENEVVADLNGAMWVDPKFWKELAARDESVFRKVAYKFMELGTKALNVVGGSKADASTIVRDVDAARAAIAQAWSDHLNAKRVSRKAAGQQALAFDKNTNPFAALMPGATGLSNRLRDKSSNPNAPTTPEFKEFFGKSTSNPMVAHPDGTARQMYHGTARDITKFKAKQAGAIFVTREPRFAEDFADASENFMWEQYLGELSSEQRAAAKAQAIEDAEAAYEANGDPKELRDIVAAIQNDDTSRNALAEDFLRPRVMDQMPSRGNIMPLYVRAEKTFDYENPDHIAEIAATEDGSLLYPEELQRMKSGDWRLIERNHVQRAIKAAGFDSFTMYEGGQKNLAVYDPGQVKSVTGNNGDYDRTNEDIRFSKVAPVELPDRITRNLTESERSKIRRDVAARLVELFDQLPSDKEMAAIAFAGRAARGWYKDSAAAIGHVFGPDADRFAALLAAMSPQNSVQTNLQNAAATWANWVQAGRPQGRDEIIEIMGRSVVGSKHTDSVLPAWINNSVRALTSAAPENLVISGPKVNSFMKNLRGNVQEVTNDSWMAAYAAIDQKLFGGALNAAGTDPGKGSGYLAMSAKVRQAAQTLSSLTGDAWTPAEVQETVWSWAKTLYELQSEAAGGYGAREIIDNGELRDELIAATPEFSSLLLDDTYGQPLREAGYGERIDDLRTLPSAGGRNKPRAEDETRPFAERTQRGYERAVADRLEQRRDRVANERVAGRAENRRLRLEGGVGGGDGGMAFSRGADQGNGRAQPLEGLPATVKVDGREVTFGPFQPAHDAAAAYMQRAGMKYEPARKYAKVDRARAERIAAAFDSMKHEPQNPVVKRAYEQMIRETLAQYEQIMATGLTVEFIDFAKTGDPYGNPRNAILDVVNNNHMWVFSTKDGFGSSDLDVSDNPLLAETPFEISGQPALANDIFRVVHDYFGHIKDGVGFRADGEENAWRSHAAMYSPLARMAMTSETRGQNSWLNFGPYGEANRTAKTEDTHFADQKIGLLPQWAIDEGRTDADLKFSKTDTPEFKRWFGDSKAVERVNADTGKPVESSKEPFRLVPKVMYHTTRNDFNVFEIGRTTKNSGTFGDWETQRHAVFVTPEIEASQAYGKQSGKFAAGANVMPLYVKAENPLDLTGGFISQDVADQFEGAGLNPRWLYRFDWSKFDDEDGRQFIEAANRLGYDSVIFNDENPDTGDSFEAWALFSPEQIKSATGNNGQFDTNNADIRFSRDPQKLIDEAGGIPAFLKSPLALRSVTIGSVAEKVKGRWTDLRSLNLQMLGGRQLAEVYKRDLPQLTEYQKLVQQMQAGISDGVARADGIAVRWGKIKDRDAMAGLMHDTTLARVDPSEPFAQGQSESQYKELRERFLKLSPEARKMYVEVRDAYAKHGKEVKQAMRERVERAAMTSPRKAQMLTRMDDAFKELQGGPYFPLARFGQYLVVVRDAEGKTANVSRAETKAEADALRRDLKARYGLGYTVSSVVKAAEFNARTMMVGSEFLEKLFNVLDETGIGEDMQDEINQLVLSSLPEMSWGKHGIHRKGTPGFSEDARRAFAHHFVHGSRHLQRLRYSDQMDRKLSEMQKYVTGRAELTDSVKAQQVLDEVNKRHEAMMSPKTSPWSQALTSFGFFFHLGLSPASALVNLTQVPLVAGPILDSRYGLKSAPALMKAMAETTSAKNDLTKSKSLSADERRAIEQGIAEGTIDVTLAHDAMGISEGQDSKLGWKLKPVMRAASFMFHHAERFNRQVTFLAAYRLAREKGMGHAAAVDSATEVVYTSQFDYSSSNRPRALQGDVARVVTQFKQYVQNMLFLQADATIKAFKGDRQALRQLAGMAVMHGLAAGAMGMHPLIGPLMWLASAIGGDDDDPWDAKVALQNYLADAFGNKPAEVMMRGVSRLGPADVSARIGLDLNQMLFPDVNEGLEGADAYSAFVTGLAGPVVGGIGGNVAKGIQLIGEGHTQRGIEAMLPSVLRGPARMARYAEEGAKTKSGETIKDDVGVAGLASQTLGFRPSEVALAQEGRGAILNMSRRLDERRSSLLDDFARSAMKGEDTSQAVESIQKWNEAHPQRVIAPMHLQQSVHTRVRRIAQTEQGVSLAPNKRDVLAEGRFATTED